MFIQQSVVVKEFEKEGFECQPLGYDDYYETDIDYQQCLAALLVPSEDNVVLEGNEYSFIPFDKRVKKQDGKPVDAPLYNPVGGGTSMADLMANSMDNDPWSPPAPAASSDEESAEYEGLAELSGCGCNMIVTQDPIAGDKAKEKQLLFYQDSSHAMIQDSSCKAPANGPPPANGSPPSNGSPPANGFPPGSHRRKLLTGSHGQGGCTMDKATAVLMFKQFISVNNPCDFVKRNTPFACTKSEPQPPIQILSLAYANSGLFYSVITALAVNYMYATKKVNLKQVDIEHLHRQLSSAGPRASAEEEPAK